MAGVEGDVWRQEYDRSQGPSREPGPIELNRYVINGGAYAGIPTFMNWPICLTPEDLKAGNVDIAVIGAPIDMSFGQRGTAWGPRGGRVHCVPQTGICLAGLLRGTFLPIRMS